MKIAILSSASAGGAGIAAHRIYQAFCIETEHEVDFFDMESLGQVDLEVSPTSSATNGKITNTHFTIDYASDVRQWVIELLTDYDVINVQWASYLVSLAEIQELAKLGKKILFTLHDFHYITGGCHYPAGCLGYLKNCVACPQVDEKVLRQQTVIATNKLKRDIFSYPNVHLSAPSHFIVDNAIRSGIVPPERAHVLRNAYSPVCDFEPERPSKSKSILLIADSFDEQRKGLALAVDALKLASSSFNQDNIKVTLHLVGALDAEVIPRLNGTGIKVVTHGHIKNHDKLVEIFKRCQYILTCSYEDNWPNILVEAGSYGCIPIVGKWHGCEEFVNTLGLGYVASAYTSEQYAGAINKALSEHVPTSKSENYVKNVRNMHFPKLVVGKYIDIFDNDVGYKHISNSPTSSVYFSFNYLASMKATLIVNGENAFIEIVGSPFGGVNEITEYGVSDISQLIGCENDKKLANKHSYGLTNYRYKF